MHEPWIFIKERNHEEFMNFYKMAQNGFILLKCAIFIKSKVSTLLCHFEHFLSKRCSFHHEKIRHFLEIDEFPENHEIHEK